MTIREQLVEVMKVIGATRDNNAKTAKYLVFNTADPKRNYYIGKSGALRVGPTVANSISLYADKYIQKYLNRPVQQPSTV